LFQGVPTEVDVGEYPRTYSYSILTEHDVGKHWESEGTLGLAIVEQGNYFLENFYRKPKVTSV